MKVEVNFRMKSILKRNSDFLHHLNRPEGRRSSRRRHRQSINNQGNLQRSVEQLLTVKRALFVDRDLLDQHHQQTGDLLKAEMAKIEEEQSARYNFDFKNELPLQGNYQWIKISSSTSPSLPSPSPSSSPSSTTIRVEGETNSESSCSPMKLSNWTRNLPDERDEKINQQLRLEEKASSQCEVQSVLCTSIE